MPDQVVLSKNKQESIETYYWHNLVDWCVKKTIYFARFSLTAICAFVIFVDISRPLVKFQFRIPQISKPRKNRTIATDIKTNILPVTQQQTAWPKSQNRNAPQNKRTSMHRETGTHHGTNEHRCSLVPPPQPSIRDLRFCFVSGI